MFLRSTGDQQSGSAQPPTYDTATLNDLESLVIPYGRVGRCCLSCHVVCESSGEKRLACQKHLLVRRIGLQHCISHDPYITSTHPQSPKAIEHTKAKRGNLIIVDITQYEIRTAHIFPKLHYTLIPPGSARRQNKFTPVGPRKRYKSLDMGWTRCRTWRLEGY